MDKNDLINEEICERAENGVYDCNFCGGITTSLTSCDNCHYEQYFEFVGKFIEYYIIERGYRKFTDKELDYLLYNYFMVYEFPYFDEIICLQTFISQARNDIIAYSLQNGN